MKSPLRPECSQQVFDILWAGALSLHPYEIPDVEDPNMTVGELYAFCSLSLKIVSDDDINLFGQVLRKSTFRVFHGLLAE